MAETGCPGIQWFKPCLGCLGLMAISPRWQTCELGHCHRGVWSVDLTQAKVQGTLTYILGATSLWTPFWSFPYWEGLPAIQAILAIYLPPSTRIGLQI